MSATPSPANKASTTADARPAPGQNRSTSGQSRIVNMLEAKTHLSRLVDAIETGAEQEVVIARNGRPVARLTSLRSASPPRRLGVARGAFVAPDSIDASNPLIEALFEGG